MSSVNGTAVGSNPSGAGTVNSVRRSGRMPIPGEPKSPATSSTRAPAASTTVPARCCAPEASVTVQPEPSRRAATTGADGTIEPLRARSPRR
jgi:hypothetical protein